jgi:hypothetical protein
MRVTYFTLEKYLYYAIAGVTKQKKKNTLVKIFRKIEKWSVFLIDRETSKYTTIAGVLFEKPNTLIEWIDRLEPVNALAPFAKGGALAINTDINA